MSDYITTHKELVKLHGESVTCYIHGDFIEDAKISVDVNGRTVRICQDVQCGNNGGDKLGYKYSWVISFGDYSEKPYEEINGYCTEIKLINSKKKTIMSNLTEKIKKALLSEPEKSYVEHGFMNIDKSWTREAVDLANDIMLEEFMATKNFTDKVDAYIKSEKESK